MQQQQQQRVKEDLIRNNGWDHNAASAGGNPSMIRYLFHYCKDYRYVNQQLRISAEPTRANDSLSFVLPVILHFRSKSSGHKDRASPWEPIRHPTFMLTVTIAIFVTFHCIIAICRVEVDVVDNNPVSSSLLVFSSFSSPLLSETPSQKRQNRGHMRVTTKDSSHIKWYNQYNKKSTTRTRGHQHDPNTPSLLLPSPSRNRPTLEGGFPKVVFLQSYLTDLHPPAYDLKMYAVANSNLTISEDEGTTCESIYLPCTLHQYQLYKNHYYPTYQRIPSPYSAPNSRTQNATSPWLASSRIVLPYITKNTEHQYYQQNLLRLDEYLDPDYNGLHIKSIIHERSKFERVLQDGYDTSRYQRYRASMLRKYDKINVPSTYDFYDDVEYTMDANECVRPSWTFDYNPNCISFHELVDPALQRATNQSTQLNHWKRRRAKRLGKNRPPSRYDEIWDDTIPHVDYLAHGYYRDTWVFQPSPAWARSYAVKHLRMNHDQDIMSLEKIKTEALIMERLTSSPVITNIYGHCGTSTIVEMAEEVTNDIVPYDKKYMFSRGRVKQSVLDKLEQGRQKPYSFNNYTIIEKLKIAIAMAEAIAEQHGYSESVIVNDDAHPDQWLFTSDGRYILNDMNNAVFLHWKFAKKQYCKYYSSYGGDYRAPEEVSENGAYVDETVDIWPMGNLLFSLLTGLWPYYNFTSNRDIQRASNKGQKPYLNPNFRTSSSIERRMIDVMNQCHELNPTDRISIFDVVSQLKEIWTVYNLI